MEVPSVMNQPAAASGAALALDPATDAEVIAEVLAGASARFEVLLRRYNQRLFRVARSVLHDDAEAEDALQQAYVVAFTRLSQLDNPESFRGWMTRITVREALRLRGSRPTLSLVEPSSGLDEPTAAPDPEGGALRSELRALLENAIDTLPEAYRTVVVMRDVQELSTRETADALDVTEEAVRVRLHRARRALRQRLEERTDVALGDVFAFAGARCDRISKTVLAIVEAIGG